MKILHLDSLALVSLLPEEMLAIEGGRTFVLPHVLEGGGMDAGGSVCSDYET